MTSLWEFLKAPISEGSMFDLDSSSVLRSLIGLFGFRSYPVAKVYQHRSARVEFGKLLGQRGV